jgi:hypothetical protein
MATYVGSATSQAAAVDKEYPVANGVTVSDGDFVFLTSGRVSNASIAASTNLLGVVHGGQANDPSNVGQTLAATGVANGSVTVLVDMEPNAKYAIKVNNVTNTFSAAHVGQYMNLTGATGAQVVDMASLSAAGGQVQCIGFAYKGDATVGLFIVSKGAYKKSA